MVRSRLLFCIALVFVLNFAGCMRHRQKGAASGSNDTGMIQASTGRLSPVYAPLAEQITEDFDLAGKQGIGIDVGSGPGTLILELCERTPLHWINADINPKYFPYFFQQAQQRGFTGRVSAVYADACALPFHDDYADIIISRGSLQLWPDLTEGFRQIYRVLKPGGFAFIGRGFPRDLPVETARKIRKGGRLKYDVDQTEKDLKHIMGVLNIETYRIHRPKPSGAEGINYGVWVEFYKPEKN